MKNSNVVSDDFLAWLDKVIKFSKESIFMGGECDDMQIRLMEQIRGKYVSLNSGLNTINEPIKDEELDKILHDEIYNSIADNIGNIIIAPTVKKCIEAAKKYAASKLNNSVEDKWIRVDKDDSFPETHKDVITINPIDGVEPSFCVIDFCFVGLDGKKHWDYGEDNVTYYQPLPPLPNQ